MYGPRVLVDKIIGEGHSVSNNNLSGIGIKSDIKSIKDKESELNETIENMDKVD